jgi:hypothetical protein
MLTTDWSELFTNWVINVCGTKEELHEMRRTIQAESMSLDFREIPRDESPIRQLIKRLLALGRVDARCYDRRFFRSKASRFSWGDDCMVVVNEL